MEKTKLNVSVAFAAAAAWLLGLYAGYLLTGILVGYVLLKEDSQWLKKSCLRVLLTMLIFSLASTAIHLIPDLLQLLYSFLNIFRVDLYLSFIHNIFNFLSSVLSLVKTVLFVLMGIAAALNKNFKVPVLDPFIDKLLA